MAEVRTRACLPCWTSITSAKTLTLCNNYNNNWAMAVELCYTQWREVMGVTCCFAVALDAWVDQSFNFFLFFRSMHWQRNN